MASQIGPLAAAALVTAALAAVAPLPSGAAAAPASAGDENRALDSELDAVRDRAQALIGRLTAAAARAAALRETRDGLSAAAAGRASLFRALESLQQDVGGDLALAVHGSDWSVSAWSGRIVELTPFRSLIAGRADVFVVDGSVSTALIASAPVRDAAGATIGHATCELTVATRRNIRNEYLRDFDLLADAAPGVEVRYVDLRDRGPSEHAFPPLPQGVPFASDVVRSAGGSPVASVRVTLPHAERDALERRRAALRLLSAAVGAALAVWLALRVSPLRLALGATLLRLAFARLGPPWPAPDSPLLSPERYSALSAASPWLAQLSELARSPLDLLLTALWLFVLVAVGLLLLLDRAPARSASARALLADLLALPVLGLTFLAVFDTVTRAGLDLEDVAILPKSAEVLVVQSALLLVLATGAALLTGIFALAGPFPATTRGRLLRAAGWGVLLAAALRYWPRAELGLPLLPAIALYLGAATLAGSRDRWRPRLSRCSLEARAGLALAGSALLATLLFPSLVHYGEKNLRRAVERVHAPLVLRQPEWRDYVLRETRRKIDDAGLLESEPQGPHPPEIEELAYAVWSATDLAAFGFSSAVELQDASGAVVSRFALNLPSLAGGRRPLPATTDWLLTRERSTVASAERPVLHARRLLAYDGRVRGAVHVFVGDDYWNLPFLHSRDPYSVLYRRTGEPPSRTRPLGLLVYDAELRNVFSSDDQPPMLDAALRARVRAAPTGVWATVPVDGRLQHAFLFADGTLCYGIFYPRSDAGHYLADLVEAVLSLTLVALALLAALLLVRTLLRRTTLSVGSVARAIRRRFALRLFVAFMLVAMLPVLVLQNVVERFVSDRLRREAADQALELAAVAKKAVEDFALFQHDEAPGDQPVTDAALVWVASLIRNDLDVFERGRLLASSKRELYASGLLPQRLSGEVFRAIALDGETSSLRSERIGGFAYQAVSVPLRFESGGPRVLSIPLALRQRELQAVVEDLRRSIRLASVLFLAAAAGLAVSMSRRISDPVHGLTAATRRIAAGDFAARVGATTHDEFQELVESFNRMAEDLERQRRDLEHTNRLAAWAEMARQVAHEVKNPLTPIQLAAEHLRRVWSHGATDFGRTLDGCTATILKQVRTLRGIVTEFSSFARPPASSLERLELGPLALEVARAYQEVLPPDVRLDVQATDPAPAVADRRLLERALVNLVENALQAVGESGTVQLRVGREAPGRAVVDVLDSGPGLDAESRARVFEPFFSTKANGTGLGLALVKKIAEDHGGGASIESAPGEPTRARLWLPLG